MIRVYAAIPNIAFRRIVQQYAFEFGHAVFTVKEEQAALVNYTYYAVIRN